jgi:hypothetical protein
MESTDLTATLVGRAGADGSAGLVRLGMAMLGACLVAGLGLGCVDTEPALKFKGFTGYPGSLEQQTLTCNPQSGEEGEGGGGGGTSGETYDVNYTTATCDTAVDPADIETFQSEAGLNIDEFATFGQPGFGTDLDLGELRGAVCQDQQPDGNQLQTSVSNWFANNSGKANYTVSVNIINNLEDNRNTGAQGGGGGGQGGSFEGLYADGNDVKLETIEVRFPNVGGDLGSQLNRDVPVAAVVDTQGGAVNLVTVRLFSSNQVGLLEDLHRQLYLSRTGADNYGSQAQTAEIVLKAEVRALGETLSGKKVTSNEVLLPIRLCRRGTACDTTGSCGFRF